MNFDAKAKTWDDEKRIARAKFIAGEIQKALEGSCPGNAMEFGCGTGLISFNLREKFREITLIDTSKGMIDVVNEKISAGNIKNMVSYNTDINQAGMFIEKFDVIYTSMAMHHILDIETVLKRFYELLNEEGYLIIVDLNEEDGSFHSDEEGFEGHNGFNQVKLMNQLTEIGFKAVGSHDFLHGIKPIGEKNIEFTLFLMKGRK